MTTPDFLENIRRKFGGGLGGAVKRHDSIRKPYYQLLWSKREDVRRMVEGMLPHLVIKKEAARIVLEFLGIEQGQTEAKEKLYQRFRRYRAAVDILVGLV